MTYQLWTRDELARMTELAPDHTDRGIAAILGKTAKAVRHQRIRRGLVGVDARTVREPVIVAGPNTHRWERGDTVVCVGDSQPMIVVGYAVSGDVVTVYLGDGRRRCPEPMVCSLAGLYGVEGKR